MAVHTAGAAHRAGTVTVTLQVYQQILRLYFMQRHKVGWSFPRACSLLPVLVVSGCLLAPTGWGSGWAAPHHLAAPPYAPILGTHGELWFPELSEQH